MGFRVLQNAWIFFAAGHCGLIKLADFIISIATHATLAATLATQNCREAL